MKNKSLLIATVFAASAMTVSAQDLTSKKGETMLPESGDWAISFDATPFLNYAGQLLSNAGATAPTAGYTNGYPWAIKGKMFKDEKTAYRAGLRLGFGNQKWTGMIATPQASSFVAPEYPAESPMGEDEYKASYNSVVLTGGLEMRRGKTRLQGYYGGELVFGMGGTKNAYTYSNALSAGDPATLDPNVTIGDSYDFGSNLTGVSDPLGNGARQLELKSSSMMFGLRGFIGVEYFILPKISIGAEYGWGLGFGSTKTTSIVESQGFLTSGNIATSEFTTETKTGGFMIDSDIQNSATGLVGGSGSLNIIFHF
jgi:hypothetical protein